jgi:N-acyl-D-amino-acid deacylase
MDSCDLLITGGTVVDGTGAPRYRADIAITDDRIIAVGDLAGMSAAQRLDAAGMAVAPGFIDVHTHDDRVLLSAPDMRMKVSQGVTTVVTGNCGVSLAPFTPAGRPPAPLDLLGAEEWYRFPRFADYVAALEDAPPAINAALQVGHSTLRVGAMDDVSRAARPDEIRVMKQRLKESMAAGAIGFSTGLYYPTNKAAPLEEVAALAEELPEFGGIYTTHMRDEGAGILDSLDETFETGRRAGVPVVISHHKCSGRPNFGRSVETLPRIETAMLRQKVGFDVYPYVAGSTVILPDRIADAEKVMITWSVPYPEMSARYLSDIAEEWGCTQKEAATRLRPGGAIYFMMDEADVRRILAHPGSMIGSDGLPHDTHPHPRLWGTFPRVLGHYCRDIGLFPLEEAVRKMTGLSAEQFQLAGRGVLKEGNFADIVVFDPATVIDASTFEAPLEIARGIAGVIVNGRIVWRDGASTGARPGRVLKNPKTMTGR